MEKEQERYVRNVFGWSFHWMDSRDTQRLYESMRIAILSDIEQSADVDFNEDDVRIAIRRVLFKRLDIID